MSERRFAQVDVFTAAPRRGNPPAVVIDADGLGDAQMADFARWTNLSETTYLLPPSDAAADYRVRIFTPGAELPFAGHPTPGSCWVWLAAGGVPQRAGEVVQQCGVGLVRLHRDGARLAFAAPALRRSGAAEPRLKAQAASALRLPEAAIRRLEWVDNGPGWIAALLADAATVLALAPDFAAMGALKIGVIGPHPAGSECAFEVRAFAPGLGVSEDPVTGSLNAGLALWLIGEGPRYVAALGRAGRVHVEQVDGQTWVGGDVAEVIRGTVTF